MNEKVEVNDFVYPVYKHPQTKEKCKDKGSTSEIGGS
jgi:hypothetical protein